MKSATERIVGYAVLAVMVAACTTTVALHIDRCFYFRRLINNYNTDYDEEMRSFQAQVAVGLVLNVVATVMGVFGIWLRWWILLFIYGILIALVGIRVLALFDPRDTIAFSCGAIELIVGALGIVYAIVMAATRKKGERSRHSSSKSNVTGSKPSQASSSVQSEASSNVSKASSKPA